MGSASEIEYLRLITKDLACLTDVDHAGIQQQMEKVKRKRIFAAPLKSVRSER